MTKIKFKLLKFEKALVFQVLEMDERFRSKDKETKYINKKSIEIKSSAYPSINIANSIFLRGSALIGDFDICINTFKSNTDRDIHFDKMLIALKDWAENWEKFKENEPVINANDNDVYEL